MAKRKIMKELATELISAPSSKPTPWNQNPDEGYGDDNDDDDDEG